LDIYSSKYMVSVIFQFINYFYVSVTDDAPKCPRAESPASSWAYAELSRRRVGGAELAVELKSEDLGTSAQTGPVSWSPSLHIAESAAPTSPISPETCRWFQLTAWISMAGFFRFCFVVLETTVFLNPCTSCLFYCFIALMFLSNCMTHLLIDWKMIRTWRIIFCLNYLCMRPNYRHVMRANN